MSHEVQGALLYEALPYYQVRPEVLNAMSPKSRALFEDLRPIVHQGVFGEATDAYMASIEIARRLQDAGISAPDEHIQAPEPAFFLSAGTSDGDTSGQSGSPGAGRGNAPSQPGVAPGDDAPLMPAGGTVGTGTGTGDGHGAGSRSELAAGFRSKGQLSVGRARTAGAVVGGHG